MRFQVPQFTDVEDKIFGPFTFKQFLYLAGGAGASILIYYSLPTFIAIILIIPIAGLAASLAFLKINNRPFVILMESFFKYLFGGKLYIWRHEAKKKSETEKDSEIPQSQSYIPRLTSSKLKELTWNLDIKESSREKINRRT